MNVSLSGKFTWSRGGFGLPRLSQFAHRVLVLTVLLVIGSATAQNNIPLFDAEMTRIFEQLGAVEIDCPVEMSPSLFNPRCALFSPVNDYELFRNLFDRVMQEAFGDSFEVILPWQLENGAYLKGFAATESPFTLLVAYVANDSGFMALAGTSQ